MEEEKTDHKTNLRLVVGLILVFVLGVGTAVWIHSSNPAQVHTYKNAQNQTMEISYKGRSGVDALTLLKQHAVVQTKHYSFGDEVVSINGTPGNGPKYWTFYINGKMSDVGAGEYKTKNTDTLDWKLQ